MTRGLWTFCLTMICLATPAVRAAELDKTAVLDLFSQGKAFFAQANDLALTNPTQAKELYAKAARRFERIVTDGGIRSGRLYYNIGNTYFRMGDVGRAILNYRRAETLIPNDPNLHQNLNYARTKRVDQIPEREQTRVLKTLFFWHYDLSSHTRLVVFAVCFALLWTLASIKLFSKRGGLTSALVVCGLVAAMMFASLAVQTINEARNVAGVIVADEVVARKGNSATYQRSFSDPLHAGTEFRLLDDRGDWYQIELADGRQCWLPADAMELLETPAF